MNEADVIKLAALAYWRYDRQHIAGAIECNNSDVLTLSRSLMLAETEVKISISDMRREISSKHRKHWRMRNMFSNDSDIRYSHIGGINYFYFIVPQRLKDKAVDIVREFYPYAGLLICRENIKNIYGYIGEQANVYSVKPAKRMQRPKPDIREITRIAYAASNTSIRLGNKLYELSKEV